MWRHFAELSVDLRRASDRLPGRVAALHVLGIESSLPQRGRSAASDVKSIKAEHYHRIRFRQLTRPLLHALRVAPDGAFDDFLRTGYVVPRTRVTSQLVEGRSSKPAQSAQFRPQESRANRDQSHANIEVAA
jgi:hypothetical protein